MDTLDSQRVGRNVPERSVLRRLLVVALSCGLMATFAISSSANETNFHEKVPGDLENLEVDQKLDAQIPLDLEFVDSNGKTVKLAEFFNKDKPVLLTLVYYRCPMMCNLILSGLVDTLTDVELDPYEDFEIVTVSIDPRERPTLAKQNKQGYLKQYGRASAENGWHFLTGKGVNSQKLADSVGFPFRYLEKREEFAHPASIVVLTPEGRVSQYLDGIANDGKTMRLSLVDASKGKIGSAIDQLILYCYQYDATEGRYAPVAIRIMQLGGGLTMMIVGFALFGFWRREIRQKRLA